MSDVVKSVSRHPVWVVGYMGSSEGWHTALEGDAEAREVEMDIRIEYDGSGYLVLVESSDGSVFADDWCESLEEAEELAEEAYGVRSWNSAA